MTDEITTTQIEAGAEELYHVASRGKRWNQAPQQVRQEFRGIVRRVMGAAHAAELARQSQQRDRGGSWRLPGGRS